jgi:hypothetical protein
MRIAETLKTLTIIESKDYGSSGIDAASLNIGLAHSLCIILSFGALTGNSILTIYGGATKGAKTTAIDFYYKLATGVYKATDQDGLGALTATSGAALTLTAATYQHKLLIIEIRPDQLAQGLKWLTVSIDSTATVLNVAGIGIADPRYAGATQVSMQN